jgi:two-component system, NtrC family, C4-dicarboxylate transport response regulator DctD
MVDVLLVDDNPEILTLNKRILQHLGCRVTAYSEATRALTLLEIHNPYDVIITDVKMPVMNGVEFFHAIKHRHPDAAVIFTSVSSYAELQSVAIHQLKGAVDYLFGGCFTISRFKKALEKISCRKSV